MKLNILTNKSYSDSLCAILDSFEHTFPLRHIASWKTYSKLTADNIGEIILFEHHRCFIKNRESYIFDNTIWLNIAEHCYLLENALLKWFVAAENENIRIYSK